MNGMKPLFGLVCFLGALMGVGGCASQVPSVSYVKISPLGDQDKPIATIWISDRDMPSKGPPFEENVKLSRNSFLKILAVTNETACAPFPRKTERVQFGEIEVRSRDGSGSEISCKLDQIRSCKYLADLLNIKILYSEELVPVERMRKRFGCS